MKLLKYFAFVMLLVIALKVYADTYTAVVSNKTTHTIGTVTWNLANNSTQNLSVGGYGDYSMTVSAAINSVTISGQTVPIGGSTTIYLSDHSPIAVSWSTSGGGNVTITLEEPQ